ncbi:DUF2281 domain-containing protein [Desulfonauticus submarinus]
MQEQLLEKKINQLPDELKKEVLDFIDFLIVKYNNNVKRSEKTVFTFDWEGGLSDYKDKYTSV